MSEAVNLQPFAPADGLHSTITREEYDQIDRTSFSRLKLMGKSALQYRANARRDSPALTIGRAIHLATLEPERYAATVAVWTGKVRNGKAWDAFEEEHAGKEILTRNEDAQARAMAAAVHANPFARKYLAHGTPETSVLWHANGLACKCRIDMDSDLALVELKSTVDASPEGFGRQSFDLDYAAQNAWYSDGYYIATGIPKPTVVIAVEKQFPYEVVVYRVDHLIPRGRRQYLEWLERLAYCTKYDIWPGYAEEEMDLPLPGWVPVEADEPTPTQHFVTDSPAPVSSVAPSPLPRGQASEDVFNHKEAGHGEVSQEAGGDRGGAVDGRQQGGSGEVLPGGVVPIGRDGTATRRGGNAPALPDHPEYPDTGGESQSAAGGLDHQGSEGRVLPLQAGDFRGDVRASVETSPLRCMLFGCGAAALKDNESGGWFCEIHIGVPLSIRLEGKRAFRKEAAIGR